MVQGGEMTDCTGNLRRIEKLLVDLRPTAKSWLPLLEIVLQLTQELRHTVNEVKLKNLEENKESEKDQCKPYSSSLDSEIPKKTHITSNIKQLYSSPQIKPRVRPMPQKRWDPQPLHNTHEKLFCIEKDKIHNIMRNKMLLLQHESSKPKNNLCPMENVNSKGDIEALDELIKKRYDRTKSESTPPALSHSTKVDKSTTQMRKSQRVHKTKYFGPDIYLYGDGNLIPNQGYEAKKKKYKARKKSVFKFSSRKNTSAYKLKALKVNLVRLDMKGKRKIRLSSISSQLKGNSPKKNLTRPKASLSKQLLKKNICSNEKNAEVNLDDSTMDQEKRSYSYHPTSHHDRHHNYSDREEGERTYDGKDANENNDIYTINRTVRNYFTNGPNDFVRLKMKFGTRKYGTDM